MKNFIFTLLVTASFLFSACSDDTQAPKDVAKETAKSTDIKAGSSSEKYTPEMSATGERSPRLELAWETQGFSNPESVIHNELTDVLFVSNVNGSPNEKDGNGYISIILPDGTMLRRQWVVGLHAPKGLAIHNDTLYVADIDTLLAIDIPSGTINNSYKVEDAKFLNDVAAGNNGDIFVSDMVLNRIHRLSNEQFEVWLESDELENPNGLHIEGETLILGAWGKMTDGFATEIPGHLKSISIQDMTITSLGGTPIGNLDGVESDGGDGYYVTDWMAGKLYRINKTGDATLLLELEQGMADHEIIHAQGLLLLPMMNNDKVLAYKIR